MKRSYNKHVYSGRKVNPKRSRAGLLRYHGTEIASRRHAWRDDENGQEIIQPQSEITKTYKAVHNTKDIPSDILRNKDEDPDIGATPVTWTPRDPDVEKHELTIERESPHNFKGLGGYRIVDIKHVLNWVIDLQADHSKKCTFGKVKLMDEARDGLSSFYQFECAMCGEKWNMCSEKEKKINKSFVWGTLTAASYYSQSTHMLAIMDIPSMSADKFRKLEVDLGKIWQDHLWEEMQEAAKQERDIAVQKGHVGSDGVPYICVYVDGGWSKRSYGHNFNASSGVKRAIRVIYQMRSLKEINILNVASQFIYENIIYVRKNLHLLPKNSDRHNLNLRNVNKMDIAYSRLIKVKKSFMGQCLI